MSRRPGKSSPWMAVVAAAVAVVGWIGLPSATAGQPDFSITVPYGETLDEVADPAPAPLHVAASSSQPVTVEATDDKLVAETGDQESSTQGSGPPERMDILLQKEQEEIEEYDPWEPYNEAMFSFNYNVLDRYFLKPAATAWDWVLPDPFQRSLSNAFDNLAMPRRVINNLLQLKLKRAGYEVTRFILNTTIGVAGLFDIAKEGGIEKSDEDTGQTMGFYGIGPGPYLILPALSPLTVRDGVGLAVDMALDPLSYVLPFAASVGRTVGNTINQRSLYLELFQNVEENTLDLYSAVRNGYLQRRQRAIEE